MSPIDFDTSSSFDIADWLKSDEAIEVQRHLEDKIIKLLFSDEMSDLEFRRMVMQLAWLGTEHQNRSLLAKEIVQLEFSSDHELIQCGWKGPERLWKGACKATKSTVNFISNHSTEILIGAALCATGVGIAFATGYTLSVAVSGVVIAGAGSIFTSEEKPNPHIPQHLPYPSQSELAIIQQPMIGSSLPDPELPHTPNGFLVTSKGIWSNGQFYSNEPLMQESLFAPPSLAACQPSIAQSAPFLGLDSQLGSENPFHLYQCRGGNSLAFGLYDQSVLDLSKAILEDPSNPAPYFQRGAAHFGLGEYEKSLEDFQQFEDQTPPTVYPHSTFEFSCGVAVGATEGVYESGKGFLFLLSDFISHPIHTSKQIVDSITILADLVRKDEWGVIVEVLSPELHQLVTEWDCLPSNERGRLAGFAIGKNGADILIPGAIAKVASKSVKSAKELAAVCKNLQIAQETLILETAAGVGSSVKVAEVIEAGQKTAVFAEELGISAKEMGKLKQAGKLETTIAKSYELLNPSMQESFDLHKKAQDALRPFAKTPMPESRVRELIHEKGIPTFPRPKGIPDDFVVMISGKGAGMIYMHPENTHISIRVMPGKPHSPFPHQQKPYVLQMESGKAVDKFGNRIDPASPDAHIPLEEFIYKK